MSCYSILQAEKNETNLGKSDEEYIMCHRYLYVIYPSNIYSSIKYLLKMLYLTLKITRFELLPNDQLAIETVTNDLAATKRWRTNVVD